MEKYSINKDDYVRFIDVLDALSKHCLDCEIQKGRIRIRSNNRLALYDITLPQSWQDVSIALPVIKSFLEIAKLFIPDQDDSSVDLEVDERFLTLRDTYSVIRVSLADSSQLNNKYITDEDLGKLGISEKETLANFSLNDIVLKRLKTVQKNFAISVCYIADNSLYVFSESKTKLAKFPLTESTFDFSLKFPYILFDFPYVDNVDVTICKLPQDRYWIEASDGFANVYTTAIVEQFK